MLRVYKLLRDLKSIYLFDFSINLFTLMALVLAIGIVVDDSVHFMLKYAKARKKGLSPEDSVRDSFKNVGIALTITSIGLVIGFSILAHSVFAVKIDMAMLTAITIGFALFVQRFRDSEKTNFGRLRGRDRFLAGRSGGQSSNR